MDDMMPMPVLCAGREEGKTVSVVRQLKRASVTVCSN